jgi:hypothetical protein
MCAVNHREINQSINHISHIGFEFLTSVVITSPTLWDKTSCNLLKINGRFGRIYRFP